MRRYLLVILCFLTCVSFAQQPFEEEINDFRKQDSIEYPQTGSVLFVGSSSFRLWKNLSSDFPGRTIINRGFGGSSLPDVIEYADEIIYPYKPKQVVIYCGENDIASGTTGAVVFERFQKLFGMIRQNLPKASIVYVSMKPSPSRLKFIEEVKTGNRLIREFLAHKKNTRFVDVFTPMLDEKGAPKEELFVSDMLHMNERGYAIWKKEIGPYLK